jgi:adenylosuccinate lyase
LNGLLDPLLYIGRCPEQVDRFLNEFVDPMIEASKDDLEAAQPELKV